VPFAAADVPFGAAVVVFVGVGSVAAVPFADAVFVVGASTVPAATGGAVMAGASWLPALRQPPLSQTPLSQVPASLLRCSGGIRLLLLRRSLCLAEAQGASNGQPLLVGPLLSLPRLLLSLARDRQRLDDCLRQHSQ